MPLSEALKNAARKHGVKLMVGKSPRRYKSASVLKDQVARARARSSPRSGTPDMSGLRRYRRMQKRRKAAGLMYLEGQSQKKLNRRLARHSARKSASKSPAKKKKSAKKSAKKSTKKSAKKTPQPSGLKAYCKAKKRATALGLAHISGQKMADLQRRIQQRQSPAKLKMLQAPKMTSSQQQKALHQAHLQLMTRGHSLQAVQQAAAKAMQGAAGNQQTINRINAARQRLKGASPQQRKAAYKLG